MRVLHLHKVVSMAGRFKWATLLLTSERRAALKALSTSRSAPTREVERAKFMLDYADNASIDESQRLLGFSWVTIHRCVDKALRTRFATN